MRKRIINSQYELAQICVPAEVAEFIISKNQIMRDGESRQVYEHLFSERNLSHTYDESQRNQYLTELFWVIGRAKVAVVKVGERESVPTNYLECEVNSFGFDKVQPCVVLSLRIAWPGEHRRQLYESMEAVVEGKMWSFKTDFYFHDMMTLSRDAFHHSLLWTVGTSHTMTEVLDSEGEAAYWVENIERDIVRKMVYGLEDETYMGSALRVMSGDDDLYYYHDGAVLHRVSREKFKAIHDRHVERAKSMAKELLERKVA